MNNNIKLEQLYIMIHSFIIFSIVIFSVRTKKITVDENIQHIDEIIE